MLSSTSYSEVLHLCKHPTYYVHLVNSFSAVIEFLGFTLIGERTRGRVALEGERSIRTVIGHGLHNLCHQKNAIMSAK